MALVLHDKVKRNQNSGHSANDDVATTLLCVLSVSPGAEHVDI